MDPARAADAATRPSRDVDFERFEDELAKIGYVMSLDLAITLRRLPFQAIAELRAWIAATLAIAPERRPAVPLNGPATAAPYLRRMLAWLATEPVQPCPWCGERKRVSALDPCGHLVCAACWGGASLAGCPICHRRTAVEPFAAPTGPERVTGHGGALTLVQLAFDLEGAARARFEALVTRAARLSPGDRAELEGMIDALGPAAAAWLPAHVAVPETRALVLARLWLVAPDRSAMARATAAHVTTAGDVLRLAVVLMGGAPDLTAPGRLRSLPRDLRRALLEALDRLPSEALVEELAQRRSLWKRVGERLHPFEEAARLPQAALAFAIVRRTRLDAPGLEKVRAAAVLPACVALDDTVARRVAWAAPVEDALRAGNPRSSLARLTHRPRALLARTDHLVRLAQQRQVDALPWVIKAAQIAATRVPAGYVLALASHVARRSSRWPHRVFFVGGDVRHAWRADDRRTLLRPDVIGAIIHHLRGELLARADRLRHFPRAVIDRALVDIPVAPAAGWPRGSELAIPPCRTLRIALDADPGLALPLSVALFDEAWRHVGTCSPRTPEVERAARHAGGYVDLQLEPLQMMGVRHAVTAVFAGGAAALETVHARIAAGPAPDGDEAAARGEAAPGRTIASDAGEAGPAPAARFALRGRAWLAVPLAIDLGDRRARWLDVRIADRDALRAAGGFRAMLAHVARDHADLGRTHARPTMGELACVHAAARANVVYVRERDGSFTAYRRREREPAGARLVRLLSGAGDDGRLGAPPSTDAPTWFALRLDALSLPAGSCGYALSPPVPEGVELRSAAELLAELAPR